MFRVVIDISLVRRYALVNYGLVDQDRNKKYLAIRNKGNMHFFTEKIFYDMSCALGGAFSLKLNRSKTITYNVYVINMCSKK